MPIYHVKGGYRWGHHGHVYPSREGAVKQAQAAYAHGYKGKKDGGIIEKPKGYANGGMVEMEMGSMPQCSNMERRGYGKARKRSK